MNPETYVGGVRDETVRTLKLVANIWPSGHTTVEAWSLTRRGGDGPARRCGHLDLPVGAADLGGRTTADILRVLSAAVSAPKGPERTGWPGQQTLDFL